MIDRVFPGFSSGIEVVPSQFFEELLPYINTIAELKITAFAFHLLNQFEGDKRFLLRDDFLEQKIFMEGLAEDPDEAERLLDEGLEAAEERGTLLKALYNEKPLFFLNSPKGRNALESLEDGTWIPDAFLHLSVQTELFRPTIFKLYEENIGPLTPMIADILRECEKDYPYEWIRDAVEASVTNNARSWRYIESILRNWKENGQHGSY
ncbi:MAG: DnaD domain protein [Anaerolineaceae bacterium]|nr:DnaD domain protein [Anaerolineaceae bacterium]